MAVFCLVVTTPPHQNQSATVIELVRAIYQQQHTINGVFFYQDAALAANNYVNIANDEFQFIDALNALKDKHNFPLHLCITAAEKRGLSDSENNCNISSSFIISGLGEMVTLSASADRVVQL